jgi:alpha-1,3-mannosyl-glycoprotein beta-1,2-N-acetylglucosaminyltransferase
MTFGEKGVSAGQFSQFLSSVKLNDVAVDWATEDLTYLAPAVWDADIAEAVKDASRAASLAEFFDQTCTPASDSRAVKFGYDGQSEYSPIANRFGYLDDEKAGVPRTAYKGIVHFPHAGCLKFIVPVALL